MGRKSLDDFISSLRREGADASLTVMVDMYGDMPLEDHVFTTGDLLGRFPFFDAPGPASQSYRLIAPPKRFRQQYPCPNVMAFGGMRERIFIRDYALLPPWHRFLIDRFAHIDGSPQPWAAKVGLHDIITSLTRESLDNHRLMASKLGLIKWRPGLKFSGGPHAVNAPLNVSSRRSAFLHFPITRGLKGIRYVANRGQHWRGSYYYKRILDTETFLKASPVYEASCRYDGPESLGAILR